jgi:hypothetical protein
VPAGCPRAFCRAAPPACPVPVQPQPALPRPSPYGQLPRALLQCGYLYLSEPDRLHEMMGLLGLGEAPPPGSGGGGSLDASS